ncbi:MAG: hypothetical protein P4M09_27805 [Devosia sp.]|nr:hypothetical protein [Devosia sp.]
MTVGISHVQLELAREPGHPFGDPAHVYHLYVPLTSEGHIDMELFRKHHQVCRVRRRRPGEPEAHGRIVHGPGGRWIFDYSSDMEHDSELAFRHQGERLAPGEYVSIREDDGRLHTFQVVAVKAE